MTPGSIMSRLAALLFLVLFAAGIWLLLVKPTVEQFSAYRASIEQSRDLLARYIRIGGARAELRKALEQARRQQVSAGSFLEGSSIEIVAADLQNSAKSIIASKGGELKSTQILPHEEVEDWRKVIIRINMSADTETLLQVFYALETANPYLFVDNVQVRAARNLTRSMRRRAANRAVAADEPAELQVRFDVYGFMRAKES